MMIRLGGFLLVYLLGEFCNVGGRHVSNDERFSYSNMFSSLGHDLRHNEKVCHTEKCRLSARNILNSLNTLIDPCEDFYAYACGGWLQKHPVPPTENHWSQFDILDHTLDTQVHEMLEEEIAEDDEDVVKAVKLSYRACMDVGRINDKGLQPLVELLREMGGWPMARQSFVETFNWQQLIAYTTINLAVSPIILIHVDVDRKNTSRNVIIIDHPTLVLPRHMLENATISQIEPYLTFIEEAAAKVARASDEVVFRYEIQTQAYHMIQLEIELAKITNVDEARRATDLFYNLKTVRQLQNWTDDIPTTLSHARINWKAFLRQIFGNEVNDDTEIVINDLDFLHKVIKLINNTPPKTLINYIIWRAVKTMSRDLNDEMTQLSFTYKREFSAVTEDHPRWRECVFNSGYLSFAVGFMYVKKNFNDDSKVKAVTMVNNIRAAFRQELEEIAWMDEVTKTAALEKADFMKHFIGYPSWYTNGSALNEYYKGLKIGKEHFQNKLRLRKFLAQKNLKRLAESTSREEWRTSPAIVNAFYNPQSNSIIFPAGILQHPFFSADQPEALNYGSIGAVMGHEITHGFDNIGRLSDKLGNVQQWWSKETEITYLNNTQCFIQQYQKYRVPELDSLLNTKVTLNGVMTLGENIADNGGLRAALRAYRSHVALVGGREVKLPGLEHYTPDQLFFLGFANVWCESTTKESLLSEVMSDDHSPHRFRVIGTLSNSDDFVRTWQCPKESNMNPGDKCRLW